MVGAWIGRRPRRRYNDGGAPREALSPWGERGAQAFGTAGSNDVATSASNEKLDMHGPRLAYFSLLCADGVSRLPKPCFTSGLRHRLRGAGRNRSGPKHPRKIVQTLVDCASLHSVNALQRSHVA